VNDARSSPSILAIGIPQGSSCSCLVFALFVGDISDWLNDSQAVAYADDTFIWVEANTIEELRQKLESEGRKVLEYFEANRFVTNPTKTGLLILRPNKNNYSKMVINLAGAIIEEVADAKMLGMWIDNNIKCNKHTESLTSELNYSASFIWRLRNVLDRRTLKMIANGIFMSKVRYCAAVYGPDIVRFDEVDPTSSRLQALQVSQNKVLRLLTGHKKSDHVRIKDMLEETGLLSINQVLAYVCLMEYWKAKSFNIPHLGVALEKTSHGNRTLRSDTSGVMISTTNEIYANTVQTLWNRASDRFKMTNLLVIAKAEAEKLVRTLPI